MKVLGIDSFEVFTPPKSKFELISGLTVDLIRPRRKLPYNNQLNQLITEENPDVILMMNSIHPETTRKIGTKYPTILLAEEDFARSWDSAVNHSKVRKMWDHFAEEIVARTLPSPDVAVVISEAQRSWAKLRYPKSHICLLPLTIDEEFWREVTEPSSEKYDIFAIGDFNYARNAWGLKSS